MQRADEDVPVVEVKVDKSSENFQDDTKVRNLARDTRVVNVGLVRFINYLRCAISNRIFPRMASLIRKDSESPTRPLEVERVASIVHRP